MNIKQLVEEYDLLSELFLQKEYDLVWQGSIAMLIKMVSMESFINEGQHLIFDFYQVPLPLQVKNEFLLFGNVWSLLLNIVAKSTRESKRKNYSMILQDDENCLSTFKIGLLNMQQELHDFIQLFNICFSPNPISKPIDIILGISLVAVHQQKYEELYEFIIQYKQSISDNSHFDEEGIKNYKAIMDLFYSHCLIGLDKLDLVEDLLNKDTLLTPEAKLDIRHSVESAKLLILENNSVSSNTTLVNEEKPNQVINKQILVQQKWWQKALNTFNKTHYVILVAIMVIFLVRRNIAKTAAFKKIKVWVLQIFLSLKPAISN